MMKSLAFLPLILLAPTAASAQEGAIDLGIAAGGYFPDDLEVLGTSATFSPRVGYWVRESMLIEADLGFAMGNTAIGTPDPFPFLSLTPRVNMVGRVWADKPINVLFVAGLGAWYKKIDDNGELALPQGDGADLDFLGNAGPGIMVPLGDSLALRTDVRWMLSLGSESWQNRGDAFMNWEWTGGLAFMLGGSKDTDKDGIADDLDECIDEAEDMDGFEDENGCPDLDNDGDGIVDADDTECPNDAEDLDQFEDEDGCPDLDNDGDGIADVDDACMNVTGAESADGCPDADGDGLQDLEDECERDAADENDVANAFGCPDSDDDRIPDYRDECPEEAGAEDAHPYLSNGCETRAYPAEDGIRISEKVKWSRTRFQSGSNLLIDQISEIAKALPQFKKLEIQVTAEGTEEAQMTQATKRAESVQKALVDDGVEAERLSVKAIEPEGEVTDETILLFVAATEKDEIMALKRKYEDDTKTAPREAPEEGADEEKADEGEKKTAPREAPAEEKVEEKADEGEKKTAPREAPAEEKADEGEEKAEE